MESIAKANFLMIGTQKVRRVAELVRGNEVDHSLSLLKNLNYSAAIHLYKVIKSAKSNLRDIEGKSYYISELLVNEGPRHKRYRPRARGRMDQYKRRTTHITVRLKENG